MVAEYVERVLVVEDEPDTAHVLKTVLESEGFQVTVVSDGGKARAAMALKRPDLILLDLMLPGEHGIDICQRLRRTHPELPIIVLTGMERSIAPRVMAAGANEFLSKPFAADELVERIRAVGRDVYEQSRLGRTTPPPATSGDKVRFNCRCGKRLKASTRHAGRWLRCPQCGATVTVPMLV